MATHTMRSGIDATAKRWQLPDHLERCPGCGKFVSLYEGYCDVVPGGVRGSSRCTGYCSETCMAKVNCAHGNPLNGLCEEGCDQ